MDEPEECDRAPFRDVTNTATTNNCCSSKTELNVIGQNSSEDHTCVYARAGFYSTVCIDRPELYPDIETVARCKPTQKTRECELQTTSDPHFFFLCKPKNSSHSSGRLPISPSLSFRPRRQQNCHSPRNLFTPPPRVRVDPCNKTNQERKGVIHGDDMEIPEFIPCDSRGNCREYECLGSPEIAGVDNVFFLMYPRDLKKLAE
uniref:Uncharacterized protein n=1 Tax=Helicotheca tamesis TaxID=374047 RepID=A0A7S2DW78_9STRA|mmetsp:Transcript_10400/g.14554  ORF Transcript_10400/g.14554 Transcript_10400/m.14554 type:complete len:203 (+) Transcript_10400:76-684(+)